MRRSLIYFWRIHLAVALAAAVTTAVLTGALLVGDSVRGSLRQLTLERLGKIDYALVAQKFFREELANEIFFDFAQDKVDSLHGEPFGVAQGKLPRTMNSQQFEAIAPAIILNGTAVHAKTRSRAARINIVGMDRRFAAMFEPLSEDGGENLDGYLQRPAGQIFSSVVINQALQNELRAEIGNQVLLSFQKPSDIQRGSLLGNKKTEEVVESLRLTITQIIPDRGIGRFGLRPHQTLPMNAYVSLPVLQKALDQSAKINALLAAQRGDSEKADLTSALQNQFHAALTLHDFGLNVLGHSNCFAFESREATLAPRVEQEAIAAARGLHLSYVSIFTYLANSMTVRDRLLPYSTVTALATSTGAPFDSLILTTGEKAPALAEDEILLNEWAAEDLGAKMGDEIEMSYYVVGARDDLVAERTTFKLRGVVAMTGLAADPKLTPDFPGIANVDNMAEWNPPFPVDLSLIRPKDEAYWDRFRATPKAFISEASGRKLWRSRFGHATSIRFAASDSANLLAKKPAFEHALLQKLISKPGDFVFQPVKRQGLVASAGATDFSLLFFLFSLFLIASAALLVGLLFRLGLEQRAQEIGMLLSVGYPLAAVRRRFLVEGGTLAAVGGFTGLGGGMFFCWIMIVGLRTWWRAAIGSSYLFLHVTSLSLILGYVISIGVVCFAIWRGVRKLSRVPTPALLAGVTSVNKAARSGRRAKLIAWSALTLSAALTLLAVFAGGNSSATLFFGIGALLLISGLAFFASWLRASHQSIFKSTGWIALINMAVRNSPRHPARSLLSAALVACACFVIVAVGANRREVDPEASGRKDSGAGGFTLIAEADIPLYYDLNSETGRFELGFSGSDSEILRQAEILPFRLLPGDDASCLNLYQPEQPRILGVPHEQIKRGGFSFQEIADELLVDKAHPWSLLEQDFERDMIPAFGDYNSVRWILHLGLGQDLVLQNEFGQEIRLRLVGLFKSSIFQSELLISEKHFLQHFPGHSGYAYFLMASPPEQIGQHAQILESTLANYGFDAIATAEKLANFQAVENTYLSTFQTLGGLGLLLGTLGLGIILIRNVLERRGELATLRALGFRRRSLAVMVIAENGFLLLLGILLGSFAAVMAVAPHLISSASAVPWLSLVVTLKVVFLVGMLASATVMVALKIPLLPALKAE